MTNMRYAIDNDDDNDGDDDGDVCSGVVTATADQPCGDLSKVTFF